MADNVNVLNVLNRDFEHAHAYRIIYGVIDFSPRELAAESEQAIARIAELIAADVEYDEARTELLRSDLYSDGRAKRMVAANERRAAALSACTGGSNG